jgi:enhancing lycopene biosynthesis protein 2
MTLGDKGDSWPFADSISVAETLGNNLQLCDVNEVAVDKENKICTTPAYQLFNFNFKFIFRLLDLN